MEIRDFGWEEFVDSYIFGEYCYIHYSENIYFKMSVQKQDINNKEYDIIVMGQHIGNEENIEEAKIKAINGLKKIIKDMNNFLSNY